LKGENTMKKIIVLLVVLLLLALTVQVAFADPNPPNVPPNCGSLNMGASWWEPLPDGIEAPGKAGGVDKMWTVDYYPTGEEIDRVERRGMAMAHFNKPNDVRDWPTNGALHMDAITGAHLANCAPE
jgi:hypothetical protein